MEGKFGTTFKLLAAICRRSIFGPIWSHVNENKNVNLQNFEVKCNRKWTSHIYAFLLMCNGNMWPYFAPLRDIMPQNLRDLEFDLARSLKIKCECN